MKTYKKQIVAYLKNDGKLSDFQFEESTKVSNFQVIEHMFQQGYVSTNDYSALISMSSRSRSKSGIFYKYQNMPEFALAKAELLGETPRQKVLVEFETTISKDSPSRKSFFESQSNVYRVNDNSLQGLKIPYVSEKSELMNISFVIKNV